MRVKVQIIRSQLKRMGHPEALNKIAIVYMGTEQFQVSAPSQAEGPAEEWLDYAVVRKPDPEGFGEIEIGDEQGRRIIEMVREELSKPQAAAPVAAGTEAKPNAQFDPIKLLCKRFHEVAKQLRTRHAQRSTILMNDEYDVQDLMSGLLRIYFDDVRREEWTPSYAGGASRMDFLIPAITTVLEVKKTREGLADKEIGDQLLVDIGKYGKHGQCKRLICFVYDPEERIKNARGLEGDLSKTHDGLEVQVFVVP